MLTEEVNFFDVYDRVSGEAFAFESNRIRFGKRFDFRNHRSMSRQLFEYN